MQKLILCENFNKNPDPLPTSLHLNFTPLNPTPKSFCSAKEKQVNEARKALKKKGEEKRKGKS